MALTDILKCFMDNFLDKVTLVLHDFVLLGVAAGQNELLHVPAGEVTMGKPWEFPSFGWDNEYGQVTMQ